MKKMVLKLTMEDEKSKKRAMKAIAGLQGVDSVAADRTENKITVEGDADPVSDTYKLRRLGYTELLSLGPAKEEGKKPEDKPQEGNPSPVVYIPASPIYYGHNDYVRDENSMPCTIL